MAGISKLDPIDFNSPELARCLLSVCSCGTVERHKHFETWRVCQFGLMLSCFVSNKWIAKEGVTGLWKRARELQHTIQEPYLANPNKSAHCEKQGQG